VQTNAALAKAAEIVWSYN